MLRGRGFSGLLLDSSRNTTNSSHAASTSTGTHDDEPPSTFKRRDFYVNKDYLHLFPAKVMTRTIRTLDKSLESKLLGYKIPPNDHWISPQERRIQQRNRIEHIWHAFMDILWWITVPTLIVLLLSLLFILWNQMIKSNHFIARIFGVSPSCHAQERKTKSASSSRKGRKSYVEVARRNPDRPYHASTSSVDHPPYFIQVNNQDRDKME